MGNDKMSERTENLLDGYDQVYLIGTQVAVAAPIGWLFGPVWGIFAAGIVIFISYQCDRIVNALRASRR